MRCVSLVVIWAAVLCIGLCFANKVEQSRRDKQILPQYWDEIEYEGNFMSTLDHTPYDVFSETHHVMYGSYQPDKVFGIFNWEQYIEFLKRNFLKLREKRFSCRTINPRELSVEYATTGNYDKKTGPVAFAMTYFYNHSQEMDSIVLRGDLNEKFVFRIRYDETWKKPIKHACVKAPLTEADKQRLKNPFFATGMNFREIVQKDGRALNQYWMTGTEQDTQIEYFLSFDPETGLPVETVEVHKKQIQQQNFNQQGKSEGSDVNTENEEDNEGEDEDEDEDNEERTNVEKNKEQIFVSTYTCLRGKEVSNEFLTRVVQPIQLCACTTVDELGFWSELAKSEE